MCTQDWEFFFFFYPLLSPAFEFVFLVPPPVSVWTFLFRRWRLRLTEVTPFLLKRRKQMTSWWKKVFSELADNTMTLIFWKRGMEDDRFDLSVSHLCFLIVFFSFKPVFVCTGLNQYFKPVFSCRLLVWTSTLNQYFKPVFVCTGLNQYFLVGYWFEPVL